jgi:hypothetical protein
LEYIILWQGAWVCCSRNHPPLHGLLA